MKKIMMLLAAVALTSLTASAQDTPSQTKAGRAVDATAQGVERGAEKTGSAVKRGAKKTGHVVKRGAQKTGHAVKKGAKKVGNKAEDVVD
ncbi:hypothetical protein EJV47_10680 [Hymenobacter gummosus]|uniref:CsbD family protein n=1 Tax=Hymenobacter gummosus TaxID=1776032 RepID=A0A3S0HNN7_9BACT|nr:hypothetical protein [Hymenobacter gummosus]RTQ50095.1 hypothetical protein EJV47_10680 [Hymenobacter gummosus]